jgi:hypothetical protein
MCRRIRGKQGDLIERVEVEFHVDKILASFASTRLEYLRRASNG